MAFQITISTAATKTAYQRFGDAYITALSNSVPELNIEQLQTILTEVISTVGRKAVKEKKVVKTPSPNKNDLKKAELLGELKTFGEFAGEIPNIHDVKVGELRKQISNAKKLRRDATKKSPKIATPSKRQLLRIELTAEVEKLGCSLEKEVKEYTITELRKIIKKSTSATKKMKSPKKVDLSKRALKKIELANEITTKGGSLEKEVAKYKVTELRKMLSDLSPKKQRKSKKTIAAETDHEALLATLANSLKNVSNSQAVVENVVETVAEVVVETVAEAVVETVAEAVVETKEVVETVVDIKEVVEDDTLESESELDSSDDSDSSDDEE